MRRGLLKDLANTPTQIACGWHLYGDLARLSALDGLEVVIDLVHGTSTADGREVSPPLEVQRAVVGWFQERLHRDNIPADTVRAATLTLRPSSDHRGLSVLAATTVRTGDRSYESHDTARWHPGDV